jgi:hypothetical protein
VGNDIVACIKTGIGFGLEGNGFPERLAGFPYKDPCLAWFNLIEGVLRGQDLNLCMELKSLFKRL